MIRRRLNAGRQHEFSSRRREPPVAMSSLHYGQPCSGRLQQVLPALAAPRSLHNAVIPMTGSGRNLS